MGDRYYTQQREYLRRIGADKTSTTQFNKQVHIDFIECVLGLESQLTALSRVSLYGLEKLRIAIEKHILNE